MLLLFGRRVAFRVWAFEIHQHRIDALNLLKGVSASVSYRYGKHQQLGVLLGDFRKQLDEIERPFLPRILLRVREAVIPSLELVEDESCWCVFEELE